MKTTLYIVLLVAGSLLWGAEVETLAEKALTPEQIVALMTASKEQYISIQSDMKKKLFRYSDSRDNPVLLEDYDITSRWTQNKSYVQKHTAYMNRDQMEPNTTYEIDKTYASTLNWSKHLYKYKDIAILRGKVDPDSDSNNESFIFSALWDIFGWPWKNMNLDDAIITVDIENGLYIMNVSLGDNPEGPSVKLYIDPSKNYIPVKKEFILHDGTVAMVKRCTDFTKSESGLWVPLKYDWEDPRVKYFATFEINNIKVNEIIPDELLDFSFPSGTIVIDNIAGLKYTVDGTKFIDENNNEQIVHKTNDNAKKQDLLLKEDIAVRGFAEDDELKKAASERPVLLQDDTLRIKGYLLISLLCVLVGIVACRYVIKKKTKI